MVAQSKRLVEQAKAKIMNTKFIDMCIQWLLRNLHRNNIVTSAFLNAFRKFRDGSEPNYYQRYIFQNYGRE
jgi:hypothetical protein